MPTAISNRQLALALGAIAILSLVVGGVAYRAFDLAFGPPAGSIPPPLAGPSSPAATSSVVIDGHAITAERGAELVYDVTTTRTGGLISESRQRHVTGNGPGLHTATEGGAAGFESGVPSASLGGGGGEDPSTATGGSTGFKQTFIGSSKASPLMWVGVVLILAGAFVAYRGMTNPLRAQLIRPGLLAAALGVGFIAASMLPDFVWWIIAGLGLAGGAFYLYEAHAHHADEGRAGELLGVLGKVQRAIKKSASAGEIVGRELEALTDTKEDLHLAAAKARADV